QVVWVQLPGLSEGYYTSFILKAIGQVTGSVIKINGNTVHAKIGQFAHMTICVDLKKPLLSKIKIDGQTQRVEYGSLPNVCFRCGLYGHTIDSCLKDWFSTPMEETSANELVSKTQDLQWRVEKESYGPWMLVERRPQRKARTMVDKVTKNHGNNGEGSRFDVVVRIREGQIWKGLMQRKIWIIRRVRKVNMEVEGQLKDKKTNIKAKGKGVVMSNGPRLAPKVLKPVNNMTASSSKSGLKPFDNGEKIGLKDDANPFFCSTRLDDRVTRYQQKKGCQVGLVMKQCSNPESEIASFKFGERNMDDKNTGQRSTRMEETQHTRPPDMELEISKQPSVEVTMAMKKIVEGIERESGMKDSLDVESMAVEIFGDEEGLNVIDHPRFHNFVKEYKREFSLDLISLFETHVSGQRVDGIIGKLGYQNSFKIEASVFFGGIWLIWNGNVDIEILYLYPQVIHMRFCSKRMNYTFLVLAIYASPQ
ncbi:hypothetical protein Gohar_025672, partial [Gossypium harknessii]|nr:hypothetical protein [Gossypium harknessii]